MGNVVRIKKTTPCKPRKTRRFLTGNMNETYPITLHKLFKPNEIKNESNQLALQMFCKFILSNMTISQIDAFNVICDIEKLTPEELFYVIEVYNKLKKNAVSNVQDYLLDYFVSAATKEGHKKARHGNLKYYHFSGKYFVFPDEA